MSAPQGLAYFAGIRSLLSYRHTFTDGISPSVASLEIPPQDGSAIAKVAPLVWEFGSQRQVFPDCTVDRIAVNVNRDGTVTWTLHILDRRWKWRFGQLSGQYNVRRGGEILEDTKKSVRDLAKLCLDRMGETRYRVDQLPDDLWPEIEWDYAVPAEALARLCDSLNCRIVLGLNNRVSIERSGVGKLLPAKTAGMTSGSAEIDPPERPDKLVFVAGKTRWQIDFELEAVGEDTDGSIKPIDELSYAPEEDGEKTWEHVDMEHFNRISEDLPASRELALKTVFRWYRIVTPFRLPKVDGQIEDLWRILPIETTQVEKWEIDDERRSRPAWVFGEWYAGHESPASETDDVDPDIENTPEGLYRRGFTIDQARGIVRFAEPVYRLNPIVDDDTHGATGGEILAADLRLRVAVGLRDKETRAFERRAVERKLPGVRTGTKSRYLIRDDTRWMIYRKESPPRRGVHHNTTEVKEVADYYLDAAEAEYSLQRPGSGAYTGLLRISPDGAIRQVTWQIARDGFATTSASRNKEELRTAPSYKERRFQERAREQDRQERSDRQQREDQERAES